MLRNLLIRGARQLITLHGSSSGPRRGDALRELSIIEDGSVLIVDGAVASVGPTRRVENLAEARTAHEINASGCVVLPGFVDAYASVLGVPGRLLPYRTAAAPHYELRSDVGAPDLAARINYLRVTAAPALEFQASRYLESFLRHGTTTLEARTGFGLPSSVETKLVRVLTGLDKYVSVVPTFTGGADAGADYTGIRTYVDWLCSEVVPRVSDRKFVKYIEVVCGRRGLQASDARLLLDGARRAGMPVKVCVTGDAWTEAAALGNEFAAAGISGIYSATDEEAVQLARTRMMATVLPARAPEEAPNVLNAGRRLIQAGVPVALGTGFAPATCSTFNMQQVVSAACMRLGFTPEEAIAAATVNAAHAMGIGSRCGSLEFGKSADLSILNVSDYREIPMYFGANLVSTVIRRGSLVYQAGSVTCADN